MKTKKIWRLALIIVATSTPAVSVPKTFEIYASTPKSNTKEYEEHLEGGV